MIERMTRGQFNQLSEDDRWMTVGGFDGEVEGPQLSEQEQAIVDRDAVIASQHQSLQKAEVVRSYALTE